MGLRTLVRYCATFCVFYIVLAMSDYILNLRGIMTFNRTQKIFVRDLPVTSSCALCEAIDGKHTINNTDILELLHGSLTRAYLAKPKNFTHREVQRKFMEFINVSHKDLRAFTGKLQPINHEWSSGVNITSLESPPASLPGYRNPCWVEWLPGSWPYSTGQKCAYFRGVYIGFQTLSVIFSKRVQNDPGWRMRCLPTFYLIGQPKCGTTDLNYRLHSHPDVMAGLAKEPHWWSRTRFEGCTLQEYIDLYDQAAEIIRTYPQVRNGTPYHNIITVDASPSLLWDNDYWQEIPENAGLSEPLVTNAQHIFKINPRAKIILILRNPVDRLYSDYLYFSWESVSKSPDEFHKFVVKSINRMQACIVSRSPRACAYDKKLNGALPVRLRIGMYSLFLRDWLQVFPKEQFRIVRFEDYIQNPKKTLVDLFQFLDLEPNPYNMARIVGDEVRNSRREGDILLGNMNNLTRQILSNFYRPYNLDLAYILQTDKFLSEE